MSGHKSCGTLAPHCDALELEMTSGPLSPGDAFVICSDGLTNHVQDDEIRCAIFELTPKGSDTLRDTHPVTVFTEIASN